MIKIQPDGTMFCEVSQPITVEAIKRALTLIVEGFTSRCAIFREYRRPNRWRGRRHWATLLRLVRALCRQRRWLPPRFRLRTARPSLLLRRNGRHRSRWDWAGDR